MVDRTLQASLKVVLSAFELDVDFAVPLEFIVLFGPSGAGKSTLLDCIAGLRTADQGRIVIGEECFFDSDAKINLRPQKRRLGYVFQRPTLFPHLSVRENICFGIEHWKHDRRKDREDYLIDLLQLGPLTERRPSGLSGGERQRVALARAIAPEPHLLLLDEPFSALDAELRGELETELHSLARRLALPMVLVTHSRATALSLADTVVCLEGGKIRAIGRAGSVLLRQAPEDLGEHARFSW